MMKNHISKQYISNSSIANMKPQDYTMHQQNRGKAPKRVRDTEPDDSGLNFLDDSNYILNKMHKNNFSHDASAKISKSVYTNDFQLHAARLLQENLAGKIIEAKNTPQKRKNHPSLYTNSIYSSQYENQSTEKPIRQKGNIDSYLFGNMNHEDKSTYQAIHGPLKKIVDDTVKPIRASQLMPKNPSHFRGESTYGSQYIPLPNIQPVKANFNQDHLNGSSLGKEIFKSVYKENYQRDQRVQSLKPATKVPTDNTHFFPQRDSYKGMFVSNYQKNFEQKKKSRYR